MGYASELGYKLAYTLNIVECLGNQLAEQCFTVNAQEEAPWLYSGCILAVFGLCQGPEGP